MSVLGNISLSGLTTTVSDLVVTQDLEVQNSLTVDNGATITLPNNSIADSYLSSNVALENANNTYTGIETFQNSLVVSPGATITLPNNSIADSALSPNVVLENINNTFTAVNTFQSNTVNAIPLMVKSVRTSPNPYLSICVDTTATAYNPIVQSGDAIIMTDNCTGLVVGPHTSSYSGFRCDLQNTYQYGKSVLGFYVWDASQSPIVVYTATSNTSYLPLYAPIALTNTNDTRVATSAYCNNFYPQLTANNNMTGLNTFTQSVTGVTELLTDNSTKLASTAFVKGQGYITSGSLSGYATLSGTQSFTGLNTFTQSITGVTEALIDNSTKLASTAYVQGQGYITSAVLAGYALLSGNQSFTGLNTFTQSVTGVTEATTNNSTKLASTAYVKNNLANYASLSGNNNFTGLNTFTQLTQGTTPPTADNSILLATTAFVKAQNYLTSASLSGYATLAGTQTFTGSNSFTQSVFGNTEATGNNSTRLATTAYVQNNLANYASLSASNTFTGANNTFQAISATFYQVVSPASQPTATQIGYQFYVPQSSFPSWTNQLVNNLYTIGPFAATGSYPYGTWLMNCRLTLIATTPGLSCCVTTTNNSSIVGPCWNGTFQQSFVVGSTQYFTVEMNYVFKIYSAQTLYFNAKQAFTPYTVDSSSYFSLTRIA